MAKVCDICGEKAGALTKLTLKDGIVCGQCLKKTGRPTDGSTKSLQDFNNRFKYLEDNNNLFNSFSPTIKIASYLQVDENNKLFKIGKSKDCFNFNELVNFELNEDGETITKGGSVGRAAVGGALFGGAGAIVASNSKSKKTESLVNNMYIRISLNNPWIKNSKIQIINFETKKNSLYYKNSKQLCDEIISALELISSYSDEPALHNAETQINTIDTAGELEKFHDLMVKGIITEEDFNLKKKALLGL